MGIKENVDAAIEAALVKRVVGCVVLINHRGRQVYAAAKGLADRESGRAMEIDTIFRLASVTKPIVATAILRLVDLGVIGLNDPVTKVLPWFTPKSPDGSPATITIRQLLSHTSGLSYANIPPGASGGLSGPVLSLEDNLRRIAEVPLAFAPCTGWAYGTSIDVLGAVLGAINGSSLEDALGKYVTGPLEMVDTHFYVTDASRLAVPYADGHPPIRMADDPYVMIGDGGAETKFSPGRIFNPAAFQSGGGGIAGKAADIMKLLEVYNGSKGMLKQATVTEALANQIGKLPRRESDAGKRFSLIGAVIEDAKAARSPCPVGTVDWGGAWGHNWIVDPVNAITVVVCTNTTFEGCDGPFREDIRDAVYASL